MIAIIDYRAGNLASVSNALKRLDVEHAITNDPDQLEQSKGVIFPGQGHAGSAMKALQETEMDQWLKQTKKPVLGICIGMQLFFESTEEGDSTTLGIIPGRLKRFDSSNHKVPHMGWNTFSSVDHNHPFLDGIRPEHFVYYVHSYYAPVNKFTIASSEYVNEFASIVAKDNFVGTQFHPEKSGKVGNLLLQNFLKMVHEPSF